MRCVRLLVTLESKGKACGKLGFFCDRLGSRVLVGFRADGFFEIYLTTNELQYILIRIPRGATPR